MICMLSGLCALIRFSLLKTSVYLFCDSVGKPSLYLYHRGFFMPRLFIHPWLNQGFFHAESANQRERRICCSPFP